MAPYDQDDEIDWALDVAWIAGWCVAAAVGVVLVVASELGWVATGAGGLLLYVCGAKTGDFMSAVGRFVGPLRDDETRDGSEDTP